MAILHADNFNIYGTNAALLLNGVYAEQAIVLSADPDGVSTGLTAKLTGGSGNIRTPWRYIFQNGAVTTCGLGMRLWLTSLPNDDGKKYQWRIKDASNSTIAAMWITSTGRLAVDLTGGSTYTAAVPSVTANGWYHIEWKYTKSGASTCNFEIRVEGQTVLTQTGATVSNLSPAQIDVTLNAISLLYNAYNKDLVIWDDTTSYNNDFLGSVLVTNLSVTADTALNWTPSSGTNGYSILDNIPPVDSTYISAGTGPIPGAYQGALSDLPSDVTSVKALITYARAAKADGGDGSLQVSLVSDPLGTPATVDGSNRPITTAQTYWRDIFQTDPKTSVPWLPAAVNAANIKINRTT